MTLASVPGERLRIVSHFPGRLRVRARTFRGGGGDAIAEALRADTGVTAASAVALTGSVLVEYDAGQVQLPALVERIVALGGLEGVASDHRAEALRLDGAAMRTALDRWNQTIVDATKGRLDTRTAVPATLAGLGLLTLLLGRRTLPQWYDLVFWSFVTFHNLNPSERHGEPH